jgi:hypothetical protein
VIDVDLSTLFPSIVQTRNPEVKTFLRFRADNPAALRAARMTGVNIQ